MELSEVREAIDELDKVRMFTPLTGYAETVLRGVREILTDLVVELETPTFPVKEIPEAVPEDVQYAQRLHEVGLGVGNIVNAEDRYLLPHGTRVKDITNRNGSTGTVDRGNDTVIWDVAPWNPIPLRNGYARVEILPLGVDNPNEF